MEEPKRRARRVQAQTPPEQMLSEQQMPGTEGSMPKRRRPQLKAGEQADAPRGNRRGKAARSLTEVLLLIVVVLDSVRKAVAALPAKFRLPQRLAMKKLPVREAAMLALIGVMLFSGWQVGSIVLRSVRTTRLNEELSAQRAELMEKVEEAEEMEEPQEPEATAMAWSMPEATAIPALFTPAPENMPATNAASAETDDAQAEATPARAPDIVSSTKYHQMGGEALAHMAALREKNHDLTAWVQIPDVLDLPVVYRDNSYYLTRDFNRQKNASGTIFLDENHPFREKTQNLLLHGHNMKDGTMFGRLAQYLHDDSYLRNHPFVYFDTLWKEEQYVIFAVLNVSLDPKSERFFNYFTHSTFRSDTEFAAYIRQLQLRSSYAIPVDVAAGDALLTLSTCLDDDRLVIVARRLREDETRSQLRELIRMSVRQ